MQSCGGTLHLSCVFLRRNCWHSSHNFVIAARKRDGLLEPMQQMNEESHSVEDVYVVSRIWSDQNFQ